MRQFVFVMEPVTSINIVISKFNLDLYLPERQGKSNHMHVNPLKYIFSSDDGVNLCILNVDDLMNLNLEISSSLLINETIFFASQNPTNI